VNKLVVAKNRSNSNISSNYMVYGNHAYELQTYDDYSTITKDDINKNLRQRYKKKLMKQFRTILMIAVAFSMGVFIIGRYALIMNLGNESRLIKNKIAVSQKANENLKLELMSYNDIKTIEKVASSELNMVHPDSTHIVHISSLALNKTDDMDLSETKRVSLLDKVINLFN
jgi:cell division protein FtsL